MNANEIVVWLGARHPAAAADLQQYLDKIEMERLERLNRPIETPAGVIEVGPHYNVTVERSQWGKPAKRVTLRNVVARRDGWGAHLLAPSGRTMHRLHGDGNPEIVAIERIAE